MYCRLQCYPSPRLISYKIPGIRVLWGFVVPLCRGVHSGGTAPGSEALCVQSQPYRSMQLTSKNGSMVVDFYPVKFATGEIHNRLMLKVVTFCGKTQSKSYIPLSPPLLSWLLRFRLESPLSASAPTRIGTSPAGRFVHAPAPLTYPVPRQRSGT